MPSLIAIIGANSEPMQRELRAVQRMANETGLRIQSGLEGGGHVRSGAMRETLVLMREISRGNWTRVPGSFTLLLQQMGILSKLTGDTASTARILADAWAQQAQKAGLAAIAATRKAAASMVAFEADAANTEATLAQAIADEEGAAAAILNAKATQQKAVAAQEAAASGAASGASLGTIAVGIAAVLAVTAVLYETFRGMKDVLKGLEFKLPMLDSEYVPKALRSFNQMAEAQKKVTDEVRKTAEAYSGAEARAKRVVDATKEHFEHLRKINSFVRDPAAKAAGELEIDRQERNAELSNKFAEKQNLEVTANRKQAEAAALFNQAPSEAQESSDLKDLKKNADAAVEYLKKQQSGSTWDEFKKNAAIYLNLNPLQMKARKDAIATAETMNEGQANNAITAYQGALDKQQSNKEIRKRAEEAAAAEAKARSDATKIGLSIPDIQKANDQKNKDEAEESAAKIANAPHKMIHGSVNNLQKVGAYTEAAVDIQRAMHRSLVKIEHNTSHLGNTAAGAGRARY